MVINHLAETILNRKCIKFFTRTKLPCYKMLQKDLGRFFGNGNGQEFGNLKFQ